VRVLRLVELTSLELRPLPQWRPTGLAATPSGVLLFIHSDPCGVSAVHPPSGKCKAVAGVRQSSKHEDGVGLEASFYMPQGIVVVASQRCAYVSDTYNHCIRRIALPAHWCVAPASGIPRKVGALRSPLTISLCGLVAHPSVSADEFEEQQSPSHQSDDSKMQT
jgi:hypothetical protein